MHVMADLSDPSVGSHSAELDDCVLCTLRVDINGGFVLQNGVASAWLTGVVCIISVGNTLG